MTDREITDPRDPYKRDIVTALDAELAEIAQLPYTVPIHRLAQRARDEIVALRETVERQKLVLSKGHAETRDEALEEAAQACERVPGDPKHGDFFAAAIRALKERGPA